MAIGEQAVVTDAMEAGWEDVEQEAAHELADVEAHDLAALTAVLAIVLPAETDMGRVEIEQTAVGDRDAMRIARQIGQDLLRTGEGLFGIDDPFGLAQRREVSSPRLGVFELALRIASPSPTAVCSISTRPMSVSAGKTIARTAVIGDGA